MLRRAIAMAALSVAALLLLMMRLQEDIDHDAAGDLNLPKRLSRRPRSVRRIDISVYSYRAIILS